MTRAEAIALLRDEPVKLGWAVGFNDLTALHNDWICEMVTSRTDATLQSHRGSYKTTCVSIALAIIIVLLPRKKTMFMRKTDTDVKEVVRQVQNILRSDYMQALCEVIHGKPLVLTTASAVEISTNLSDDSKGTSQLLACGISGSLTGKHFDLIFTDDIVNVQDRISKAERDHTKIIYQELQNIKNRGGRIFNTGTPWHKEDCFTLMPTPQVYDCYQTKLITPEQLQAIRDSMTASLFAANYELKHIASDDVIFSNPATGGNPALAEQGICHIDAAFYGEDYTAFTVMKKHGDKYYVYGRCWRKHVEDCYAEIMRGYERFMCRNVAIETNADKGMVAKELRNMGMRVNQYAEKSNKFVKIVTWLKAIWKDIVFVEGTDKAYIDQICDFNENCAHDDAADSCASLARLLYNKKEAPKECYSMFL